MYKEYMLKCSVYLSLGSSQPGVWQDRTYWFDTKEEMIIFIKNGDEHIKPEHIRVEDSFKLEKLSIEL